MVKIETLTFEYNHCAECPNCERVKGAYEFENRCRLKKRKIPDLWGEIPKWCPLENKKEDE